VVPPAGIYLTNDLSSSDSRVLTLPLGASGTVTPSAFLPDAGLVLSSLTSDGAGHFFAVEDDGSYLDVVEFGVTNTGAFTPLRRISQPSFPSLQGGTLAADASGDVAVVGNSAVYIFGPSANGIVTPARSIAGAATGLVVSPQSLAFDKSGNLYVFNSSTSGASDILVFGPTQNGDASSARTLTPNVPSLQPSSMAFNNAGNLYIAQAIITTSGSGATSYQSSVYEFAAGASGNATPIATLTPPGGNYYFTNMAFDTTGAMYVLATDIQGNGDVLKFSAGATGTAPPVAVIDTAAGPGVLDSSIVVVGP
jgi:hypothetical protein